MCFALAILKLSGQSIILNLVTAITLCIQAVTVFFTSFGAVGTVVTVLVTVAVTTGICTKLYKGPKGYDRNVLKESILIKNELRDLFIYKLNINDFDHDFAIDPTFAIEFECLKDKIWRQKIKLLIMDIIKNLKNYNNKGDQTIDAIKKAKNQLLYAWKNNYCL